MKHKKTFENIFTMVQEYENAPTYALCLKLFEEGGEFAEVLNYELGHLKPKDKEFEPLVEEAADVIITVIGTLARHNMHKHPRVLNLELLAAIKKKATKYSKKLGAEQEEYFTNG